MKYQININQLVLSETKLDLVDCTILDYLIDYCNSKNQKIENKRIIYDEEKYTWINFKTLLEDMPVLKIKTTNSLTPRLHRIKDEGFIKIKIGQHKRLHVCLTDKIDILNFNNREIPYIQKSSKRLLEIASDNHDFKNRQNEQLIYDNNTNDKEREHLSKISSKRDYLKNIPLEDIKSFGEICSATKQQIYAKADDLYDYCLAKGKKYSDYKAFLRNALKKDYPKKDSAEKFNNGGFIDYDEAKKKGLVW